MSYCRGTPNLNVEANLLVVVLATAPCYAWNGISSPFVVLNVRHLRTTVEMLTYFIAASGRLYPVSILVVNVVQVVRIFR